MRIGPSFDYRTRWIYMAPGLPMEVLAEFGNWRQVRDCDGVTGWMHVSLLSARRTAMIGPWTEGLATLHRHAYDASRLEAKLGARVRMKLFFCDGTWCRVDVTGHDMDGWVRQTTLCGAYPGEKLDG